MTSERESVTTVSKTIVKRNDSSNSCQHLRLALNIVTHVFMLTVVIICVSYAVSYDNIDVFQLHIIFCVIGYQFLMYQATLVLSQYNIWSKFLTRKTNKLLHQFSQLLAIIFVITGSSLMYSVNAHFQSAHGIFALLALLTSLFSLNGFVRINPFRYFHYITGVLTLYLAAISLCFGLNMSSFKKWTGEECVAPYFLMVFIIIVTTLVCTDFFIYTKKLIMAKFNK